MCLGERDTGVLFLNFISISIRAYVLPHNVDNSALHREDALVQSTVSSVVGGLVHFHLG